MSLFKTKFSFQTQTQLRSSAGRQFQQKLKTQYPHVSDAEWSSIFPSKSTIIETKLTSKIIFYSLKSDESSSSDANNPVIFFIDNTVHEDLAPPVDSFPNRSKSGRKSKKKGPKSPPKPSAQDLKLSQIIPTLYLLYKHPNILPSVYINAQVSHFVLRGADLMVPGISWSLHSFFEDLAMSSQVSAQKQKLDSVYKPLSNPNLYSRNRKDSWDNSDNSNDPDDINIEPRDVADVSDEAPNDPSDPTDAADTDADTAQGPVRAEDLTDSQREQLRLVSRLQVQRLRGIERGSVMAIKIVGNDMPIGIGYSLMHGGSLHRPCKVAWRSDAVASRGRLLRLLHTFEDELWRYNGCIVPNIGFKMDLNRVDNNIRPVAKGLIDLLGLDAERLQGMDQNELDALGLGLKKEQILTQDQAAREQKETEGKMDDAEDAMNAKGAVGATETTDATDATDGNVVMQDVENIGAAGGTEGVDDQDEKKNDETEGIVELPKFEMKGLKEQLLGVMDRSEGSETHRNDVLLEYAYLETLLLAVPESSFPVMARDIYQQLSQRPEYLNAQASGGGGGKKGKKKGKGKNKKGKGKVEDEAETAPIVDQRFIATVDVKDTQHKKLQRFVKLKKFETLMVMTAKKGTVAIESIDRERIAVTLLLLRNDTNLEFLDSLKNFFDSATSSASMFDAPDFGTIHSSFLNFMQSTHNCSETEANDWVNRLLGGWDNLYNTCNLNASLALSNHIFNLYKVRLQTPQNANANASDPTQVSSMSSAAAPAGTDANDPSADAMYRTQFLATLKYSVDPDMLPLAVSPLLSLQCFFVIKPQVGLQRVVKILLNDCNERGGNEDFGTLLQRFMDKFPVVTSVKQTHFKQLKTFLKSLQKEGIIDFKEKGESVLTDVDFDYLQNRCEDLNNFGKKDFFDPKAKQFEAWMEKIKQGFVQAKLALVTGGSAPTQGDEEKSGADAKSRINVDVKYRPNHRLLPIFGEDKISDLQTKNQCQTMLWSYIEANGLVSKQDKKQFVKLNNDLFHMLYESKVFAKLSSQNAKQYGTLQDIKPGTQVERRTIVNLFDKHLEPYSAIIVTSGPNKNVNTKLKYRGGMPAKIKVFVDKRQGRKFMTHVLGLEVYFIDYKDFASQAKKQYACSTSIQDLTGKAAVMKGGHIKKEVLIQGNVSKDITKLLNNVYGIDSRFVDCNVQVTKQGKS